MKVAVRCEKHSPILGQQASWHTECNFSSPRIALVRKYSGETGARTLIQSGCFRSIIASLLLSSFLVRCGLSAGTSVAGLLALNLSHRDRNRADLSSDKER